MCPPCSGTACGFSIQDMVVRIPPLVILLAGCLVPEEGRFRIAWRTRARSRWGAVPRLRCATHVETGALGKTARRAGAVSVFSLPIGHYRLDGVSPRLQACGQGRRRTSRQRPLTHQPLARGGRRHPEVTVTEGGRMSSWPALRAARAHFGRQVGPPAKRRLSSP